VRYNQETREVTMSAAQASVLLMAYCGVGDPRAMQLLKSAGPVVLYASKCGLKEDSEEAMGISLDTKAEMMAELEQELAGVLYDHARSRLAERGYDV